MFIHIWSLEADYPSHCELGVDRGWDMDDDDLGTAVLYTLYFLRMFKLLSSMVECNII